jgi:hypothetical protein
MHYGVGYNRNKNQKNDPLPYISKNKYGHDINEVIIESFAKVSHNNFCLKNQIPLAPFMKGGKGDSPFLKGAGGILLSTVFLVWSVPYIRLIYIFSIMA